MYEGGIESIDEIRMLYCQPSSYRPAELLRKCYRFRYLLIGNGSNRIVRNRNPLFPEAIQLLDSQFRDFDRELERIDHPLMMTFPC